MSLLPSLAYKRPTTLARGERECHVRIFQRTKWRHIPDATAPGHFGADSPDRETDTAERRGRDWGWASAWGCLYEFNAAPGRVQLNSVTLDFQRSGRVLTWDNRDTLQNAVA